MSLAALLCIAGASTRMPGAAAAPLDAPTAAQVDDEALGWLKGTGAPSVSLAIVRGGALAYAKAYERVAIVTLTNNDWASPAGLLDRIAFLVLPPTPAEARARELFAGFQNGTVDRSLFTATGNFYLTDEVLADLHASLGALGRARLIELEREFRRGGMVTRTWKILCDGARLSATERGYPGGPLDEFMIARAAD